MVPSIAPGEAAVVLFVLISLGTISPAKRLINARWRRHANPDDIRYEDKDGIATKESTSQLSNQRPFIVIFLLNLCGLGLSFANLIVAAIRIHETKGSASLGIWLLPPAWVRRHSPTTGSHLRRGLLGWLLTLHSYFCWCNSQTHSPRHTQLRNSTACCGSSQQSF